MLSSNLKVILGVSIFSLALGTISLALMPDPPAEIVARAMAQPGVLAGNAPRADVRIIPLPEQQRQVAAVVAPEERSAPRQTQMASLKPAPLADLIEKAAPIEKPVAPMADPQPKPEAKPETRPETKPKDIIRRTATPARERPVREASAQRSRTNAQDFYPYDR